MMADEFTAAQWRKSTRSAQGGADCVEIATLTVAITEPDSTLTNDA
ncbi:DUF397 domain-containing protein [Actinoallomurus sp. NPDC052308]